VAQVYKWCDAYVAHLPGVKAELGRIARQGGRNAEAILDAHHHAGHARIVVEQQGIDWIIALDDSRGEHAAMSIEFGRGPGGWHRGPAQGIFALSRAFG